MQGGPDPALPQTFVEQQPGGARVSPGQERGEIAGQGAVVAGKKQGVPGDESAAASNLLLMRTYSA